MAGKISGLNINMYGKQKEHPPKMSTSVCLEPANMLTYITKGN